MKRQIRRCVFGTKDDMFEGWNIYYSNGETHDNIKEGDV